MNRVVFILIHVLIGGTVKYAVGTLIGDRSKISLLQSYDESTSQQNTIDMIDNALNGQTHPVRNAFAPLSMYVYGCA